MSNVAVRVLRRSRRAPEGTIALESLVMMVGWLIAVFMMFNILLVATNRISLEGLLNRLTIQATAQGCLDQDITSELQRLPTFGAQNITLTAVTPTTNSLVFDPNSVKGSGAQSAMCAQTAPLSSGRYMYFTLSYTQKMIPLPLFVPSKTPITLTSLGVSHTLNFG